MCPRRAVGCAVHVGGEQGGSLVETEGCRNRLEFSRTRPMEGSKDVDQSAPSTSRPRRQAHGRSRSVGGDKDTGSVLKYCRAVRRLHDRRLAQAEMERSEANKRASWHVDSSYLSLWPAVTPPPVGEISLDSDELDGSASNRQRYASAQCLSRPCDSKTSLLSSRSHASSTNIATRTSWTPLGKKRRFSSFWSLNSDTSSQEMLDGCSPCTGSPVSDRSIITPDNGDAEGETPTPAFHRRQSYALHGRSTSRISLDLERRHNVATALSWVHEQIRDLQDADRELASQMAEVLGSMRSLRVELEEDIAAEELADCGENDVDGEVLFRRNTN